MANLKDFSFEKIHHGDKVLHKELGIGEVLGICKPSVQIFFPDMCGGTFMDLKYKNGWNLENTGIEFIGEFRREKLGVEDKQGMTWAQFLKNPGPFCWENVMTGMVVNHKEHGYGVVISTNTVSGTTVQFEYGCYKAFKGDSYKDFTKIGPWTEEALK